MIVGQQGYHSLIDAIDLRQSEVSCFGLYLLSTDVIQIPGLNVLVLVGRIGR